MRIGAYDIESEIGRGGSGVVFRARAADGGAVALKVLRALDGDALRRFERESRLARSLGAASGFVPVLDAGQHGGAPFLVFPLLEGGTLRELLDGGPLPLDRAIAVGRALARALAAAHERGIVHRDVKPENIIFARDGAPLLADLGLAKHFDGGAAAGASRSLSAHGALLGTAGYMPPEQMADAKSAGPPVDVFAAGCVLYECVCGRPPFAGETVIDVIARVEHGRFAGIRTLRPETPRALAAVIERALARDPAKRFQDGGALERALAAASARAPRTRAALVASLLVVLIGAGALVLVATRSGRTGATPARPAPPPPPHVAPREDAREQARALVASAFAAHERDEGEETVRLATAALALDPSSAEARAVRILGSAAAGAKLDVAAEVAAALASDPRSPLALLASAAVRASAAEAEATCSAALAVDPRLELGYVVRGCVRMTANDLRGARDDAEQAIALGGRHARSWLLRADARRRDAEERWAEDLARATELAPRSVSMRLSAGQLRYHAEDLAGALADFDRAIEMDPTRALALCLRGQVHARRDRRALAEADLSRAIELDPALSQAWLFRATTRRLAREPERGASDAEHVLELAPGSDGEVFAATGLERTSHGHPAAARRMLEAALARDPPPVLRPRIERWLAEHPASADPPLEDGAALVLEARQRLDEGAEDRAIDLATRAIAAAPTAHEAWGVRAMARQQKGDTVRAIADATQAVDLAPGALRSRAIRATIFLATGDLDRALADATAAIASNPHAGQAYQLRATVRRKTGDRDGALADCAVGLRYGPTDGTLLYTLGVCLAERGQIDAAREAFETSVQVLPPSSSTTRFVRGWLAQHPRLR